MWSAFTLDQVKRALAHGLRVAAWTFDELYGRDNEFLDGLEGLGQNYVAEVPSTFTGWLREPEVLIRPTPEEMRNPGKKPRFPRLARKAPPASPVCHLLRYSRVFQKQKWQRFHIKDGEKGPMVWEAKNELGMDHFEVRGWRSIHRHLYITQLTHLFCARVHQKHREKNDPDVLLDGGASPLGLLDLYPSVRSAA